MTRILRLSTTCSRNDIDAPKRTLSVVKDILDYAVPEFFETDEEFDDFHACSVGARFRLAR